MSSDQVTRLLGRAQRGEPGASDELAGLVHDDLQRMAQAFMADQKAGHTLQPTALVNEAWMRVAAGNAPQGRAHFLRVAAAAMRSILVDHARRRGADKRGGGRRRLALDEAPEVEAGDDGSTMIALHDVLERLADSSPVAAQVAEMRLFGGMEHAEVAEVLGASLRTVERQWQVAREWLRNELPIE